MPCFSIGSYKPVSKFTAETGFFNRSLPIFSRFSRFSFFELSVEASIYFKLSVWFQDLVIISSYLNIHPLLYNSLPRCWYHRENWQDTVFKTFQCSCCQTDTKPEYLLSFEIKERTKLMRLLNIMMLKVVNQYLDPKIIFFETRGLEENRHVYVNHIVHCSKDNIK